MLTDELAGAAGVILKPLQLKLAIAGVCLAAAAIAGTTIWALLERSGRLELKAQLVRAEDQVDVLADRLSDQSKAINDLSQATHRSSDRMRELVDAVAARQQAAAAGIAKLERSLKDPTPRAADGRVLDCRDALKAWREELTR